MANHLIIGLGGTGGQILCALRKRIYAELGTKDVTGRANIDYLYVDSSEDDLNDRTNWTYMGEPLYLGPAQKVSIHGMKAGVLQTLHAYPGIQSFLSEKDRTLLQNDQVMSIISAGIGGQRRRFGRMLMANNISTNDMDASFVSRLRDKALKLTNSGNGTLDFHVCAGLAGGTGSGSIVDVVSQIRKITAPMENQFRLFLYLYIPEILVPEKHNAGFYHANGFAALSELNALSLGKYHPTDVSGETDYTTGKVARLLNNCDAFTKAYLFSNFNEDKKVLPKSKKLPEAVADFLYQKAVVPGVFGTGTEMNRLMNAENEGCAPEKDEAGTNVHSREFMTFGIKRIEYPETEIKEYVSYKFAEQAAKQLAYNLWVDGKGFESCSIDEVGLGYRQMFTDKKEKELDKLHLSNRYLTLQAPIRNIRGVTDNWQEFYSYWETITQFFAGEAREDGEKKNWIDNFVKSCEVEFNTNFRGVGVKHFYETQLAENKGYAATLRRHIESLLFNEWLSGDKSLLEVEKYIQTLILVSEERLKFFDNKVADLYKYMKQETLVTIESILNEWNNISWLKDVITGASKRIFDQYKTLKCEYYTIQTEIESYQYAKTLLEAISRQLSAMLSGVTDFKASLNAVLEKVIDAAESKCRITMDSPNQEAEVLDKKYNPQAIREIAAGLIIDSGMQKTNAQEVRNMLARFLGEDEKNFALLNNSLSDVDTMTRSIMQVCQRNAANSMNDLAQKDVTLKMLNVNVLEKIKQECATSDLLEQYVHKIVQEAKCFIQFDPAEMGKVVAGQAALGMRRMVQLCLPEYNDPTNFRDRFIQTFAQQCPGFSPQEDVCINPRESQMVIISASFSYPLRYIQNVKFLESKYKALINNSLGELNKVLLHTESFVNDLPELFEASNTDKRSKLLPYSILLHSLNVLEEKTDPETGGIFMALGVGSGFSRKWLRVGKNMEETLRLLVQDAILAKSVTEFVDNTLATEYKQNSQRETLRKAIENKVCETILPLCHENDLDPLFVEYRKAAENLFETKLENR